MNKICETCNNEYKDYYQHTKSVKHLASLQMYYCKLCNFKCNLDQKENHLNSKQHKDKNEDKKTILWCV